MRACRNLAWVGSMLVAVASIEAAEPGAIRADGDVPLWSFQPLRTPGVPAADDDGWSRNPIDRFIARRLKAERLTPSPAADRVTLIRRAYFDLVGLPPTPGAIDAFLADGSSGAYGTMIDGLLASPRYGERWARHWLDLVRYAESDGYNADAYRPNAWRYRDYVINALNDDKPYDRFVTEQLAGDEVAPHDPDALVATGLLRHWIYESNQRKVDQMLETILNDVTDVTGDVFLGLGMGCARCHDHKFDPISRKDYYRLQAFFGALRPQDERPVATAQQRATYEAKRARWEELTADIRREIAEVERPARKKATDRAFRMFPQRFKDLWRRPHREHSPKEQQFASLMDWQFTGSQKKIGSKLEGDAKQKWDALQTRLAAFDAYKPDPLPYALAVTDIGATAPPTVVPGNPDEDIQPGILTILDRDPAKIESVPTAPDSTGRRTALARWITSPDNRLTVRVIVNRVWQYHFGQGLVSTPSDFGRLGESPSHPELLDWLATWFVENDWSFKKLHRLIMTSATYRQSSLGRAPEIARNRDPDNRLLWRMNIRRLDAEQMRDAVLAVTGELDVRAGGPGVETSSRRRTVYAKIMRNAPDTMLAAFDAPNGFGSTPHRDVTTTPSQALMLINGQWSLERAEAWARRLRASGLEDDRRIITHAYRSAYGRAPTASQLDAVMAGLEGPDRDGDANDDADERLTLADVLHVLLNANEFLYVD